VEIYQVGGSLRDDLMGKTAQDHDFVVIGSSEKEFVERFPAAKRVGQRKFVYIVDGHEYTLSNAPDIMTDLTGRDLTINAIARSSTGEISAHPLALSDLEQKVLRPVALHNFLDDPLRVYRAARFKACLPDFSVHATLVEAMKTVGKRGLLRSVAAERIGNEVLKVCGCRQPSCLLTLLSESGTLEPWLEEFVAADAVPAGPIPHHSGSLHEHVVCLVDKLAGSSLLVWMGFCHDLGKLQTDPQKWPRHHGHDRIGEKMAAALGHRLRLPLRFINAGMNAARWHMTAGRYSELRTGTKVKLLMQLHRSGLLKEMFELVFADKGVDYRADVERDFKRITAVHLPSEHHNQGRRSGQMMHALRCRMLEQDKPPTP
jgi:tRNA nucleotidyltransferase (CCA-adding enzyme)